MMQSKADLLMTRINVVKSLIATCLIAYCSLCLTGCNSEAVNNSTPPAIDISPTSTEDNMQWLSFAPSIDDKELGWKLCTTFSDPETDIVCQLPEGTKKVTVSLSCYGTEQSSPIQVSMKFGKYPPSYFETNCAHNQMSGGGFSMNTADFDSKIESVAISVNTSSAHWVVIVGTTDREPQ